MGWVSTLTSAFKGLGSSIGGSISLQDATGGWSSYSATQSLRKDQMRRELKQMELAATQGPSWTMEGLRRAGINPILASDSINSWSGQHGSLGTQAPSGGSSVGFKSKIDRDIAKEQTKNIEQDTKLKDDQGEAALMQAEAAKINAINSALKTASEIRLIEKQREKLDTTIPGQSSWGTSDKVFDYLGSLGDVGTTALGMGYLGAKIYGEKGKKISPTKVFSSPKVHNPKIKSVTTKLINGSANSAKTVAPVLMTNPYTLGIGYGILGVGAGYEAFKRTNHKDNEYNKSQRWYSHGNWSR